MSLPMETVDRDGAIREAAEAVAGDTRAAFLRKAALGGGAVLGSSTLVSVLPEVAAAKPSSKHDVKILDYLLVLEYLETAFYPEAVGSGAITGAARDFARLVVAHESAHTEVITDTIQQMKGRLTARPRFDFMGTTGDPARFLQTALVLENTGVQAYLGQVPSFRDEVLRTGLRASPRLRRATRPRSRRWWPARRTLTTAPTRSRRTGRSTPASR